MTLIPDRDKIFLIYDWPDGSRRILLVDREELLSIQNVEDTELIDFYDLVNDKPTYCSVYTIKHMLLSGAVLF